MMSLSKDVKATFGVNVKYMCCENAGENKAFEWLCKQEVIGAKFEYIAFGAQQQNGRVESYYIPLGTFHAEQ